MERINIQDIALKKASCMEAFLWLLDIGRLFFEFDNIAVSYGAAYYVEYIPCLNRLGCGDIDNLLVAFEFRIFVHLAYSIGCERFLR